MNLTTIGIIVILGLGAAAAVEGKIILDAHEQIGTLRESNAQKQAVIDQNAKDAKLSDQLATFMRKIDDALKTTGNTTRQAIANAPTDDAAANAALDGVRRLRAQHGSGPASP